MAIHNGTGVQRGQQAEIASDVIPAPNGGIDARSSLAGMSSNNSIYSYNLVAAEEGLKVRPGYREWNIDIENTDTQGLGITTVIPYQSNNHSRLYAVSNEGIFEVTTFDDGPWTGTRKVGFSDISASSGHGVFVAYVDQSGKEWIFYADSENGLFECDVAANTWVAYTGTLTGSITSAANVNFIMVHKRRIWMVEKDSAEAVYLPVDSIAGATTAYYFGTKFKTGGSLVGLFNWSVDGGAGVDDYLVAISSGGDVIPHQGDDPSSSTTWNSRGVYFIGRVPLGGHIASEYAGELYLLSSYGIIAMSDLLRGVEPQSINNEGSLSFNIARLLRDDIKVRGDVRGWQMNFVPSLGLLLINTPTTSSSLPLQYVLNLGVSGWGFWRGVPMLSFNEWEGNLYFGTADDRVCRMDVSKDNITITDPAAPDVNGEDIDFSLLTSFTRLTNKAHYKQVQFIRPDFIAEGDLEFSCRPVYDYAISELGAVTGRDDASTAGIWDVSTWDAALWAGGGLKLPFNKIFGGGEYGRAVAVAMRGSTSYSTTFISFDVSWKEAMEYRL